VAFADRDGNWASATINDGDTQQYATDTLAYAQDYTWHVTAIGINGRTATTPDATFNSSYRLKDLGDEGINYKVYNDVNFKQYVVEIDTRKLPDRFKGEEKFVLTRKDEIYLFEKNEFSETKYNAMIEYTPDPTNDPTIEALKEAFFWKDMIAPVTVRQGDTEEDFTNIVDAVSFINEITSGPDIAVILNKKLYQEECRVDLKNNVPVTFEGAKGIIPIVDGCDTHSLFYIGGNATVTFKAMRFEHGFTGNHGGALNIKGTGPVVIRQSVFENNTAGLTGWYTYGGAIYVFNNSEFIMEDSVITNNTTYGQGGGLYLNTSARLKNVIISHNSAKFNPKSPTTEPLGGGLCFTGDTLEMENCTITCNEADSKGGGISITQTEAVEIRSAVIEGNTAGDNGGGIYLRDPYQVSGVLKTNGALWKRDGNSTLGRLNGDISVNCDGEISAEDHPVDEDPVRIIGNSAGSGDDAEDGDQLYERLWNE